MKPIKFKGQNCTFAKDQPQYLPLPVYKQSDGTIISCWSISWKELWHLLFTRKIWVTLMTFNNGLPPQMIQVYDPFDKGELS
jgi:hypothetical protein